MNRGPQKIDEDRQPNDALMNSSFTYKGRMLDPGRRLEISTLGALWNEPSPLTTCRYVFASGCTGSGMVVASAVALSRVDLPTSMLEEGSSASGLELQIGAKGGAYLDLGKKV